MRRRTLRKRCRVNAILKFSYDMDLVVMSVIVAMMASYVALNLAGRVSSAEGRVTRYWLVGGAVAMGAGIWSMHFIGMLSVHMPIQLGYDPFLTAISLLIAVVTSGFALAVVSGKTLSVATLTVGSAFMGAGICSMHYTGMAAMRMTPPIQYDPLLFCASVLIAAIASLTALWLAFTLRSVDTPRLLLYRVFAAVVMGIAISGMHYIGMQAARFAPDSVCTAAIRLAADNAYLGHGIGIVVLVILSLTVLASLFDARLGTHTAFMLQQLRSSEGKYRALLDAMTDAVILVDEGNFIQFANPAVTQVFGYRPEEVIGKGVGMLYPTIWRQAYLDAFKGYLDTGTKTLNWNAVEMFGLTRDGRNVPLETAFSEVVLDSKRLYASFMRDISERMERESRIRRLSRVRAVLSGINSLIGRARSREELFEGACRIAVEDGGFLLAVIGVVADDHMRPVAVYGHDDGYAAQNLHMSLNAAIPEGRGPTATALRERRACVCNDIANDPDMAPWREAALQRGYHSSVSLPLLENARVAGCVNLYAGEPRAFDEEEMKLLAELAGDISHSLDFIARDEQLDYLAYYDPLTRLANRKLFVQRLEQFLDIARKNRSVVALAKLDPSRFSAINDTAGHAAGDTVLKLMADCIVAFTDAPSHVGRVDGARFAIVFPDLKHASELTHQRLHPLWTSLGRPVSLGGQELRIAGRAGIALFPDDAEDAEGLLRNAEAALMMAKSTNQEVVFYTREMGAAISEKLSLASKLREAFERHEFVLHYQPKVALNTGAICGAEALIRWNSPDLGLVPPGRFVPLLEETGLILQVGHWALQQAAADYRLWESQGLWAPRVAVNLSPIQLRRPDFVEALRAAICGAEGEVPGIDLEITESVLMTDIEQHIDKLRAVREMGVAIAIDDFGTGYSSLAYLNKLPISTVKIDRSFIVQMADSADTMNIVSIIISLAHSMKLKVVAEGVDSQEQLKFLRLLRCDEMQGFLFSKGLPAEEFGQLLREDRRLAPIATALAGFSKHQLHSPAEA
jgi:diguanylate cyclase (GGDEF)-like protein/PAS domain S-box-containing protein